MTDTEIKEFIKQETMLHNLKRVQYQPGKMAKKSPMDASLSVQKTQRKTIKKYKTLVNMEGHSRYEIGSRLNPEEASFGQESSQSENSLERKRPKNQPLVYKVDEIKSLIQDQKTKLEVNEETTKACHEQIERILGDYCKL